MKFAFLVLGVGGILQATAVAEEPRADTSRKWEYRTCKKEELPDPRSKDLATALNKIGEEGWELVAAEPVYIFKRPKRAWQVEDVKRQINLLQTELDMWKSRVGWTRLMARKGFVSKNDRMLEETLLRDVEMALESANKGLKTLSPEPAKGKDTIRKP
jgi:hypothetical protein